MCIRDRAIAFAHVVVSNVSEKTKNELSVSIEASGTLEKAFSATVKSSFKKKLELLQKEGKVQVFFRAIGGPVEIQQGSVKNLAEAFELLDKYVEATNFENAAEVIFGVYPYPGATQPKLNSKQWKFYRRALAIDTQFETRLRKLNREMAWADKLESTKALEYLASKQREYGLIKSNLLEVIEEAETNNSFNTESLERFENELKTIDWLSSPVLKSVLSARRYAVDGQVQTIGIYFDIRLLHPDVVQALEFFKIVDGGYKKLEVSNAESKINETVIEDDKGQKRIRLEDRRVGTLDFFRGPKANTARDGVYFVKVKFGSEVPAAVIELGTPDWTLVKDE